MRTRRSDARTGFPAPCITTLIVVAGWAYFIWTGNINTIWPMFGISNQLLASVALAVGTTVIVNAGRARYAWVTVAPLIFLSITTLTAGWLSVTTNFWPLAVGPNPALHFQGQLDTALTLIMMTCVVIILFFAVRKWLSVLNTQRGLQPAQAE